MYKFTLIGQLPAKKNSWKMGKYGIYQSKTKEIDGFILQLKTQMVDRSALPLKGRCSLNLSLWQSDRTDLDGQITTLADILQTAGIVENDRQIKHIVAEKFIDNKNPRIEGCIKGSCK